MKNITIKKGDVVQWEAQKDPEGNSTGVELLMEVARVDKDAGKVYLDIVEQTFIDLGRKSRRKTGTKVLGLKEATIRKAHHEKLNRDSGGNGNQVEPGLPFIFSVSSTEQAQAAAKAWGYVRNARTASRNKPKVQHNKSNAGSKPHPGRSR